MSGVRWQRLASERRQAQNFELRRKGVRPDILLLHYTGMTSADSAVERLICEESRVSCHYLVDERGRVVQMVDERLRAWHAGVSSWAGETDINSRSIGIEIHNPGHEFGYQDFPAPQMRAVVALCRDIVARHVIQPWRVLGHSDIAPDRKADPGERFPWVDLAAAGVGLWVSPCDIGGDLGLGRGDHGGAVGALQLALWQLGYGLSVTGVYDRPTEQCVTAFQRHWRPAKVDGRADVSTIITLERLLEEIRAVARQHGGR